MIESKADVFTKTEQLPIVASERTNYAAVYCGLVLQVSANHLVAFTLSGTSPLCVGEVKVNNKFLKPVVAASLFAGKVLCLSEVGEFYYYGLDCRLGSALECSQLVARVNAVFLV